MHKQEVNRLKFLEDFMKAAGVSTSRLAGLMGITRQSVHHWFVKDDMKISQVFRLFELCGYRVEFALAKDAPQSGLPVDVCMTVVNPEGPQRLAFLNNALNTHSITREHLAETLQIGKATVYNWFKSDDCFISYNYAAAVAYGVRLSIRILPA